MALPALAEMAPAALAAAPSLINQANSIGRQVGQVGRVFNKAVKLGGGIFNTAKSVFGGLFGKRHHHSSNRPRPQVNPPPAPQNSLEKSSVS